MLIASGSWYTRIQSTFIVVGKVKCSISTKPKFVDMPKLAMMYCRRLFKPEAATRADM